jgi:hypothetical protein
MSLENLTSGLIGSAFGALLTFLAVILTLWRTRVGDRRRESLRLEEREEERRDAVVAQVLGSLQALAIEVRWTPFMSGRASGHLLEATMNFYATQHRRHPHVAEWLLAQQQSFDQALSAWRRGWGLPWVGRRKLLAVAHALGELIGAIAMWGAGDLEDEAFADPHTSPMAIARSNAEAAAPTVGPSVPSI